MTVRAPVHAATPSPAVHTAARSRAQAPWPSPSAGASAALAAAPGLRPLLPAAMRARPRRQRGFTLVELMVTVAVLAILAGMAYPAYTEHVARSRRADAKQSLVELAQKLERFYTERGTYAGATLGGSGLYPTGSRGGYYTLAITAQTADGFTITAAPTGAQASDACATFTYNQLGEQGVGTAATLSAAKCW